MQTRRKKRAYVRRRPLETQGQEPVDNEEKSDEQSAPSAPTATNTTSAVLTESLENTPVADYLARNRRSTDEYRGARIAHEKPATFVTIALANGAYIELRG